MGYHCNERKVAEIYALAPNGIPSLPNSQSVKIAIREAIKMIHSTEESCNTILAQMQALCKVLPEYSVVRDMNCIGDVLAPRIAEIGDVRRFKNKHSLIAYAGIDAPLINRDRSTLRNVRYPNEVTPTFVRPNTRSCSHLSSTSLLTIPSMILYRRNAVKANVAKKP